MRGEMGGRKKNFFGGGKGVMGIEEKGKEEYYGLPMWLRYEDFNRNKLGIVMTACS